MTCVHNMDIDGCKITNIELARQWANALRSDKIVQAKSCLRDIEVENSFCCLGVFCNVAKVKEDKARWRRNDDGGTFDFFSGGERYDAFAPEKIWNRLGFSYPGGNENQSFFSNMNDFQNLSFSQIADVIDAICDQSV